MRTRKRRSAIVISRGLPGIMFLLTLNVQRRSRPLISTFPSSVNWRRRSFRSAILSNRARWGEYASTGRSGVAAPGVGGGHAPRNPDDAALFSDLDAELDGLLLGLPVGVLEEDEEHGDFRSRGGSHESSLNVRNKDRTYGPTTSSAIPTYGRYRTLW